MKLLWAIVVLISLVVLITSGRSALCARDAAAAARLRLTAATDQAREVVRLRYESQDLSLPAHPLGGLAGRVEAALSRCGLPASVLQSLSPEADTMIGDAGTARRALRQRATLTVSGVGLPQVGTFLDAWRTGEPDWTFTSVDIAPIEHGGSTSLGTDLPLRAVLVIEGLFQPPPPSLPGTKP